ncbi:hypothetical protein PCH_Pc13g11840 [Penicillium rubens Wisconsin 54-1255]|uniref:Uncharacterized protein n=1 Tax=Penicillium rubens (strain ATCC 28089 / DSM 1075 / NRRL 1951 / Wisconsin 54-1255) TaxID=500485 RepID=B6H517_PENRW|nr:hypothetical protein PCH_Pc13g11840 [Penicillium rubens Wisconsin 54-1255]
MYTRRTVRNKREQLDRSTFKGVVQRICRQYPDSKPGSAAAAPIDFMTISPQDPSPQTHVKAAIVIGSNKETGPPNARGEIMSHSARSVRLPWRCLSPPAKWPNGAKKCLAPLFISDLTPQPRQAMGKIKSVSTLTIPRYPHKKCDFGKP